MYEYCPDNCAVVRKLRYAYSDSRGILAAEGMYLGNIDAQFGTEMEKSTKAFQMKYGLDPDGEAFSIFAQRKHLFEKMEV